MVSCCLCALSSIRDGPEEVDRKKTSPDEGRRSGKQFPTHLQPTCKVPLVTLHTFRRPLCSPPFLNYKKKSCESVIQPSLSRAASLNRPRTALTWRDDPSHRNDSHCHIVLNLIVGIFSSPHKRRQSLKIATFVVWEQRSI